MIAERLQGRAIAYEPQFDQRIGLKASYISRQIDTFLGERLNVLLSKTKYEIRNNLIYGQDLEEPFIEVMKRGVDCHRRAEGENRVDKKREEAEVEGFSKIQEVICNPDTPVGTVMLSISPQGGKNSLYQHNFYDIFTLKEENGKRFIGSRRYSSALAIKEYKDLLSPLSFMGNILDDADFLSSPIKVENVFFENADQIHSYLHKHHEFMKVEEFERVLQACERLKQEYIRMRNPRILDAIQNKADIEAGFVKGKGRGITLTIDQEIDILGGQSVRKVASGCGPSGSVSMSPFSVSDFAMEDKYGNREFRCPECKKINRRPKDGLIKNCKHCGSNKVAC